MRPAWHVLASLSLGLVVACGGDAPAGPDATIFCAKVIYDPCNTEHDCETTLCKTLAPTLQICTMGCTPGDTTACPATADGTAVTCGSGGFCQPTAATACQLNP